ncbi:MULTISPECIES: hypothetical protein [unclassified Saccharopolyspora]|uniref:hypothetical protein n=1 Tax=unclassified Saccharopolyspora TaxID=2646250 RepID=UPI001CD62D9E|nr:MULTISPECIES: hypothetical protein [unclassified Saccharopolyspora]MCA1189510.1 hypothetical protein [Saccharopolyspora sp. 6T]MCA1192987.1 hypothetical protein [Saccharopolyspora sp. 6V]MCA1228868.1 hypothetical protein [Saccharopolyspora sp. 6M]MCA1282610.1 hypothetical protein [Saccharopolyspora sp. 7B]
MSTTALSCTNGDHTTRPGGHAEWHRVSPAPGKAEVDALLPDGPGRVVVQGTDADLAAVVLRLLRKNRIADLAVGYVPVAESPATRLWGFPVGPDAEPLAFEGAARPSALVRDDNGGLLIASGRVEPITGQVYCDDQRVLHGPARSLEITPDPAAEPLPDPTSDPMSANLDPAADGLRVTAVRRGLLRTRRDTTRGRAVQAGFREATVLRDGVPHPRPVTKWAWYRHTEDLLLVRP